jgi:hypothetical protein
VSRLRAEYLAIIRALDTMDVPFRIVYAHPEIIDHEVLAELADRRSKFARFNEGFFPSSVAFPRDFCSVLPGLILFNEDTRLKVTGSDGWEFRSSPFGQGGRMLAAQTTVVVSERLCREKEESEMVGDEELAAISRFGLTAVRCPAPVLARLDDNGRITATAVNDHVDRVAALIRDERGGLHLMIDPRVVTARFPDPAGQHCEPMGAEETVGILRERLDPLGIHVHRPPGLLNPYALNLLQFDDGRILMTEGDADLKEFLESLSGKGSVTTTDGPIRYMPTWLCGGIRCLVSEEPTPILGPRQR